KPLHVLSLNIAVNVQAVSGGRLPPPVQNYNSAKPKPFSSESVPARPGPVKRVHNPPPDLL
ncbi:hypothetical protein BGX38DRAFT_1176075, partial [Terfezia claveryi]